MILRSTYLLQGVLLSICVCCHLAAPLGTIDHLIGAKYLEGLTDSLSANEPIKILRSTDRDIIIQIRRSPIAQSPIEDLGDDKDVLDQSDDHMYNKHTKSKLKSVENHEKLTNENQFVGKDIVRDRMSRLSMHKSPSIMKSLESTEYRFKDKNDYAQLEDTDHKEIVKDRISRVSMHKFPHNINQFESKEFQLKDRSEHRSLEERERPKSYQEGSNHGNTNPSNFEEYYNKGRILDMEVLENIHEDTDFDVRTSFSNKRFKDEENNKHKIYSTEHNFSDKRRNREGFPSYLSLDTGENKHDLNEGRYNVTEHKSSLNGIDMKMNGNSNFEGNDEESVHKMQNTNKETDSVNSPNARKISLRTISFKRNDMGETENPDKPSKTTYIIQGVRNKVNYGQNKLLFDHKETPHNKIIKTRSPALDSLQDLKRKFNIDHKKPSLLPGPSALLPKKYAPRLQTFRAPPKIALPLPPVHAPPNGQYYLRQQPRPTEDPVLQAERTKTALQRMILFVNAMGKVDYYVSNAARNFVDLLTHHTHEYDNTVRSRYSGKNQDQCGGEKDKRDDIDDRGDDKAGYVRIRTSKTKRSSHEHGEHSNPRNRDGTYYSVSGEYGW